MSPPRFVVDPRIRDALTTAAVPWEIKPGKKHIKILVSGRLIVVVPHGRKHGGPAAADNALATVRRALKAPS